jgi:hypothetical protein
MFVVQDTPPSTTITPPQITKTLVKFYGEVDCMNYFMKILKGLTPLK